MKYSKTMAAMAILSTLIFTDCSKSDPAPPSIIGTWKEIQYVYSSCDVPTDNSTEVITDVRTTQLKADGSDIYTYPNGTSSGTYTISGNNIIFSGSTEVHPFTVTATTLTISGLYSSQRPNPNRANGVDGCLLAVTYTRQ